MKKRIKHLIFCFLIVLSFNSYAQKVDSKETKSVIETEHKGNIIGRFIV